MTPEQRRQLQTVADMLIDGECEKRHWPRCPDWCAASYEMSIDDAFEAAAVAIRTVREVLAPFDEEPEPCCPEGVGECNRTGVEAPNQGTCSECGAATAIVLICPDGAEICRDCFDKGNH